MVQISKKEKILKYVCMFTLMVGFAYSLVLSFCWGNDPFDQLGTLSILFENRKLYFWLWILSDGGALYLNINYLYKKYGNAGKIIKAMPILAVVSAVCIALTLGHDITTWNPKRIVHWVATGTYVAFLAASIILYALKNIKREKIFTFMLIGVMISLLSFVGWFLVFGKSGMLELIPRALLEILLFILNFAVGNKEVQTVK